MAIVNYDSFSRGNANPIGSPYTTIANHGDIQLTSSTGQATTNNTACDTVDTGNSYPSDHYSQIQMATFTSGSCYVIVRATPASDAFVSWNVVNGSQTSYFQWRQNASTSGTYQQVNLNTPGTSNDTYYLGVQGQVYTLYQNGSLLLTYTDANAYLTTGAPGFGVAVSTAYQASCAVNAFTGGNFLTSIPIPKGPRQTFVNDSIIFY